MTPYKGIIRITCTRKKGGCLKNLARHTSGGLEGDVQPGCMDCPESLTQILNLEDKVIYEYRSPALKTGKRQ